MSNKVTVAARDLSKTYYVYPGGTERSLFNRRKRIEVQALKSVSFAAYEREFIGVLGKNGSGKSTLMSLLAGNEEVTTGEVLVSAEPTLLSVSAALQAHLSGRDNVRLGLLAMGLAPAEVAEIEEDVANWAQIGDAIDRPMRTYSSGMKARLKFSISTAVRREILLVDEALSTGDSTFAERAQDRMSSFLGNSGTVFYVSHSPGSMKDICSRVLWINEGELIADGDPEEITAAYRAWSMFLAKERYDKCEKIITRLRSAFKPQLVVFDEEAAAALDTYYLAGK